MPKPIKSDAAYCHHTREELEAKGLEFWTGHHFIDEGEACEKLNAVWPLLNQEGDIVAQWKQIRDIMSCEAEDWTGSFDDGVNRFFRSDSDSDLSEVSCSLACKLDREGRSWPEIVAAVAAFEREALFGGAAA